MSDMKLLTIEQKEKYLDLSLRICGINPTDLPLELIIRLYDKILEQRGSATIDDIIGIKHKTK